MSKSRLSPRGKRTLPESNRPPRLVRFWWKPGTPPEVIAAELAKLPELYPPRKKVN